MKSEKDVLVTGGCGFLGQHLVNHLIREFPRLRIEILDLKPNLSAVFDLSKQRNIKLSLNCDICDYNIINQKFRDTDIVIHLAGLVSFSLKDKELLQKINVVGTRNVLRAAIENSVKLFIHISSVAALGYGDKKEQPIDEEFRFDWDIATARKKYYMLTKHLGDVEVEKAREKGLKAVILRPGLMFGPGDVRSSYRLIKAIRERRIPFNMPGGTNVVDIRDVCKAIIITLNKGVFDGDYLLSGYNLTFKEMNKTIADIISVKAPSLTMPRFLNLPLFYIFYFLEYSSGKKLELTADMVDSAFKFRYFDNSKARKELGWEPKITFEETIRDTIEWLNLE